MAPLSTKCTSFFRIYNIIGIAICTVCFISLIIIYTIGAAFWALNTCYMIFFCIISITRTWDIFIIFRIISTNSTVSIRNRKRMAYLTCFVNIYKIAWFTFITFLFVNTCFISIMAFVLMSHRTMSTLAIFIQHIFII